MKREIATIAKENQEILI